MKRILKSAIPTLLLSVAMSMGCISDPIGDSQGVGCNQTLVTFNVELPVPETPTTRTEQTETEASISTIYVLIFDNVDADNPKFIDKKIVTEFEESGDAKQIKSFRVALPMSAGDNESDKYNIVLLANVKDDLETAVNGIAKGANLKAALESLNQKYLGNPVMPVPMASAPTSPIKIVGGNTPLLKFDMIRMVARIDVKLSETMAADYSVKGVSLYNYNTMGRVWTNDFMGTKANAVTLPSDPASKNGSYYVENGKNGSNYLTGFSGRLYALEAAVEGAESNRPCIVIELADKDGQSMGHYRADFLSANSDGGNKTYLDLLRNHRYEFNITNVHGKGFDNPKDAYDSVVKGLETNVIEWNEADMKDIYVSGDYWLSLSEKNLEFDRNADTYGTPVKIMTNVNEGWSVEGVYDLDDDSKIEGSDPWITCSKNGEYLAVTVTENEDTYARKAYAVIKAGKVNAKIYITQTTKIRLSISVLNEIGTKEITELVFVSKTKSSNNPILQPIDQSFILRYSASDSAILSYDAEVPYGVPSFVFDTSNGYFDGYGNTPIVDSGQKEVTLKVRPAAFDDSVDPFTEKVSLITFSVNDQGTAVSKSIYMRHINYALETEGFDGGNPGEEITATVKSNTSWDVSVSPQDAVELLSGNSGTGDPSGTEFKYKFTNDADGDVIFTFTGAFGVVEIKVTAAIQLPPFPPKSQLKTGGNGYGAEKSYAGAFWRADQKGERIITIPTGHSKYYGKWAVQVLDYGPDFSEGEILFLPGGSEDLSKDAEECSMDGAGTYIMGNITADNAGEGITFRVGLASEWNNDVRPVRYAKILVMHGTLGTTEYYYKRVIWLRQGHEDDYLMYPGDPISESGNAGTNNSRTIYNTCMFSPYNLTSDELSDDKRICVVEKGEGVFTAYPSQAGAGFLFAQKSTRIAIHPISSGVWNTSAGGYDKFSDIYNACPEGYTRPTGGLVEDTENQFAQSLFLKPVIGSNINAVWGYYADGYFDRLPIDDYSAGLQNDAKTSVNSNSYNVAYFGCLFYNPVEKSSHYNASLFFPAVGQHSNSTTLYNAGKLIYYWSQNVNPDSDSHSYILKSEESIKTLDNANFGFGYRVQALPVRCIKKAPEKPE